MRNIHTNHTIAFLPGWGFKASIWQEIANQFPENKVLLIDLPQEHDDIVTAINEKIPANSILIAWSLSGIIATDLCLTFPDKYVKLVTVASTPKWIADKDWPGISETIIESFHAEACANLPQLMLKFQQLVNGKNRQANLREFIKTHAIDITEHYTLLFYLNLLMQANKRKSYYQLNIPIMHIFGDQDYLIPVKCASIIKHDYPLHSVRVINNAGHIPFITHTSEFMQYLLPFITTTCTHDHT